MSKKEKSFSEQFESFKKSNSTRKLKLAEQAGYSTIEGYRDYLKDMAAKEKESPAIKEEVKKPLKKEIIKRCPEVKTEVQELQVADMIFAFDTTGSMGRWISAVKSYVSETIPNLLSKNPNLKIGIVAFGDYCDMENVVNNIYGKAYQVLNPTSNVKKLTDFVRNAQNTHGGDGDEFYELVIRKITEETPWRDNSSKSVLLISDANPHEVGYHYGGVRHNIDWREEAKKAASKGVIFDTLYISSGWVKQLSEITGGVSIPFKDASRTNDIMEATVLARGGETTRAAFYAKADEVEKSGDTQMSGVYSMYKTIVKK